jgi:hypothetical protein
VVVGCVYDKRRDGDLLNAFIKYRIISFITEWWKFILTKPQEPLCSYREPPRVSPISPITIDIGGGSEVYMS